MQGAGYLDGETYVGGAECKLYIVQGEPLIYDLRERMVINIRKSEFEMTTNSIRTSRNIREADRPVGSNVSTRAHATVVTGDSAGQEKAQYG